MRRAPSSCIMRLVEEGRPAASVDLGPDGAWQVDAAKLGASADIFFSVTLEAPIIIRYTTGMLRCTAEQGDYERLECSCTSCWSPYYPAALILGRPYTPSRHGLPRTCEAPVKTKIWVIISFSSPGRLVPRQACPSCPSCPPASVDVEHRPGEQTHLHILSQFL